VSQPKCNLIHVFSWIPDDGRAPATGIRRIDLEPTDGNITPVSVRSALFKVAGYPGNFSRRAAALYASAAADAGAHAVAWEHDRTRPARRWSHRAMLTALLGESTGVDAELDAAAPHSPYKKI